MEGNRSYLDESEPSWYAGSQQSPYQVPDPLTAPYPPSEPTPSRMPLRGPDYPAGQLVGDLAPPTTDVSGGSFAEPTGAVPTVPPPNVYRSSRPIAAVVIAAVAVVLMVPAVVLLARAAFTDLTARALVPAELLVIGLPLSAAGLYGFVASGAPRSTSAWLRLPAAYLPIGLILLVSAALAVA